MRNFMQLVTLIVWVGSANALTPPLDNSASFFSGEWAGNDEHGGYCYVKLSVDGRGWVLIDGGAGDWLGARIRWRNRQQALQVENVTPLPASAQLRIMPLARFVLAGGFNQSLRLAWNEKSVGCHLQKIEATAGHLARARSAIERVLSGESLR